MVRTGSEPGLDPPNPFAEVRFRVPAIPRNQTFLKFEVRRKRSKNQTEPDFGRLALVWEWIDECHL